MNHRIRVAATVVAFGALLASMTACSSASDDSAPLKFVLSGDATQGGGYQKMADKYFEETGTKVEIVDVPGDDLTTRLRNSAQADDLPNIAAAANVDPLWKDQLLDLTSISKDANVLPTLTVEDPADKKVKALPSSLTSVGMFINKDLWDKAGVSYPTDESQTWTWDEFVAKAKQVQAGAGAQYGLTMDASAHRLRSFLYEFGSQGVVQDGDDFSIDDEGKTALEYFKSMNDDGFMPKSVWTAGDDASATFKSGQVAAYYSGVWQIADFQANITDFAWASVPTPQQPVKATNYGAASWIVGFSGRGKDEATTKFISWLYQPENYTAYCEIAGCLPSVSGLNVSYPKNADAFALYNAEIAASPDVSAVQTTDQLRQGYEGKSLEVEPLKDETIKYLSGEQTIDQTIDAITKATKAALG
ncbi:ABC transporter substrate-binding protein [Agreia pratensis]|uniref:Alpha-1,4-digalacturonate transport system substrate-binding protein n=1 Tax=Agreia pratensis TaxID=150121 RepID=A0A1X7L2V8_9MICO|nr:extracellular solute-binding protein [Agreia pratensis]SMG47977.1 alpha-1,4-digalacturonate transport system substrate-binding protein [Agreia pratensis]